MKLNVKLYDVNNAKYIPAITIVELCNNALIGVGAAIA